MTDFAEVAGDEQVILCLMVQLTDGGLSVSLATESKINVGLCLLLLIIREKFNVFAADRACL